MSDAAPASLRPARKEDQPLIRRLVLSSGLNPSGLDWPHFTLAVDAAGEVIGCVQLKPHRDGSTELASLLVVENWRGRGVARMLIASALAAHQGPLYLMCRAGLGDFYRKFGFSALDEKDMPPYFRRIQRMMGVYHALNRSAEGLLIMRRDVQ